MTIAITRTEADIAAKAAREAREGATPEIRKAAAIRAREAAIRAREAATNERGRQWAGDAELSAKAAEFYVA